jgi:hypothetical protein
MRYSLRILRDRVFLFTLLVFLPSASHAQTAKPSPVLGALQAEMARSLEHFKALPNPPYFLSYEVMETESAGAAGSFGALVGSSPLNRRRSLGIDLRVGSYALDNTRPIRGALFNLPDAISNYNLPVEDDPDALRATLWYFTDQKYKRAVEQFIAVKTNVQVKAPETDKSGDFSPAKAETYSEPPTPPVHFDRTLWENRVRKYTVPFQRYGNIYSARAAISVDRQRRWFVSSQGASVETSETSWRLMITAFAKASDGMELPRYESFYSSTLEGLPGDDVVLAKVDTMIKELMALKGAPVMEPYVGPAILSPRATGVIFHEIFGHRIEGQRSKRENEGQTYRDKVGQKVLPEFLSVYSDPTQRKYGPTELAGFYKFDNEGVRARRVTVVENGVLKNLLMSRFAGGRVSGIERPRPSGTEFCRYGAPIKSAGRSVTDRDSGRAQEETHRRSCETEAALWVVFRGHCRRLHDDRPVQPEFLRSDPADGVPHLSRRP